MSCTIEMYVHLWKDKKIEIRNPGSQLRQAKELGCHFSCRPSVLSCYNLECLECKNAEKQ